MRFAHNGVETDAPTILALLMVGVLFTVLFWPLLAYALRLIATSLGVTLSSTVIALITVLGSATIFGIADARERTAGTDQ